MANTDLEIPNLHLLAERLERDIRARGLLSGQRYLTGVEAAHLLRVSTATANRAMALLVDRRVLVRRRHSGTFIGSAIEGTTSTKVRSVYVLVMDYNAVDMPPTDLLIQGIRKAVPGACVNFAFIPEQGRVAYVKHLLEGAQQAGQLFGVVPNSCGREVYRYLSEAQIPAVVMGSVYLTGDRLASIDLDSRQEGYLLVHHLAGRGHRRLAAFNNTHDCPGDAHFQDGINEALTEAGLPPSAALSRFVPDIETLRIQIDELMELETPPTGVIAPSLRLASAVQDMIAMKWPVLADRLEIVFRGPTILPVEEAPYVHVQSTVTFEEFANLVGRLLKHVHEEPDWRPDHVVLPVELRYPNGYGTQKL